MLRGRGGKVGAREWVDWFGRKVGNLGGCRIYACHAREIWENVYGKKGEYRRIYGAAMKIG